MRLPDRVRSIFYDEPVVIVPFTQDEVGKIVEKRYEILGEGRAWIKPVDVRVIQYLHSSFNGRIRDLMNSIIKSDEDIESALALYKHPDADDDALFPSFQDSRSLVIPRCTIFKSLVILSRDSINKCNDSDLE